MNPGAIDFILWGAWLLYWGYASRSAARAQWRESRVTRLAHVIPLGAAAILLCVGPGHLGFLDTRWLPVGAACAWTGVLITAAGLGFSVWARVHLGRNWSGEVELKEDHRLIRGGPYKYARHPIYTGLLGVFFGSAVALGELRGLLAVALAFAAFLVKSRREEKLMVGHFGAEYEAYRREVKALIPYVY